MLIFLYGQDTYRLQQKSRDIEERYRKTHKSALNLEKIDAGASDFKGFWDVFSQRSMFVKKKLFFLENIFSNEQFKKNLLKNINDISKSQNVVVAIEKKDVKKTDPLFQALNKYAKFQNFAILTGAKLRTWALKEFSRYGAKIKDSALQKLIDFVGNDLWRLSNEIKKLAAYTKDITERDIDLLLNPRIETQIFATIDVLAQGNRKRALRLVDNHLAKGDSPLYLLSMIAYQFRNLLLVKSCNSYGQARALGLHPFVLRKASGLAGRFSLEELKKIYQKIFETDLSIKTGKISAEEGLKMLILGI